MRRTPRIGKISAKLALLAAATVVGTGATIPFVVPSSQDSKANSDSTVASNTNDLELSEQDFSTPSFSIEAPTTIESSAARMAPAQSIDSSSRSATSSSTPPPAMAALVAPPPESSLVDSSPSDLSPPGQPSPQSLASTPNSLSSSSSPNSSARIFNAVNSARNTESDANSPYVDVQVFFATNRAIVDPQDTMMWLKILLPAILAVTVFVVMVVAVFRSRVPWIWGIGAAACLLLCVWFAHGSIIDVQRLNRIAATDSVTFANGRNPDAMPLNLGVANVTVPRNKTTGHVPTPSLLTLEFAEDNARHVVIQSVQSNDHDEFMKAASDCMHECSNEALVFVHGYNVTFDAALRRTAQLHEDLDFDGVPFLFSWPSHGSLLRYSQDEGNASWSIVHLERFLTDLRRETGVERVHIIAHSMGNRVLLGAIERMQLQHEFDEDRLGQVVLAAPDVDVDEFRNRYSDSVASSADQVTLYISGADRALEASRHLHGYDRLGLSILPDVNYFAGIQVIDVSEIDTSLLGHSYYGSNALLLQDLQAIVELGSSPSQRRWLTELSRQDEMRVAYQFDPDRIRQARGTNSVTR